MSKRLLLVDDLKFVRLMEPFLAERGFSVCHCMTIAEASLQMAHYDPDLLIVDGELPDDGHGTTLIAKLKLLVFNIDWRYFTNQRHSYNAIFNLSRIYSVLLLVVRNYGRRS